MKMNNDKTKAVAMLAAFGLIASMIGYSMPAKAAETTAEAAETAAAQDAGEVMSSSADSEHVIEADGTEESYTGITVEKSGDSDAGDEADFYGDNAAIFATNGAALTLSDIDVSTDGTHANAVFSYGEGTTVHIFDSTIETSGNCSGGLMTTGGGTMNAENLTIHTTGNSSAAIRSDRGGGTVNVTGGSYTTDGTGSPVIYSTADITVEDAELTSTASQGVVVEGKNSVTLNHVTLTAENNTKNSDKSDWYQAVMIYQSMSGDAAEGEASFTMNGGTLTNLNGDVFFVNNTVATISLSGVQIVNEDGEGVFLRAAAAGWGSEGSNGGQVTLQAAGQEINGDMVVDEVSHLNLYLTENSSFNGAILAEGEVYVEIEDGSTWTLTGDSAITGLTCGADAINLNGYTLTVNGETYAEGTESSGEAIEAVVSAGGGMGRPGEGGPGEMGKPGEEGHGGPSGMGKPGDEGQGGPEGMEPPTDENGERLEPPTDENGERQAPPEKPGSKTGESAEESSASEESED